MVIGRCACGKKTTQAFASPSWPFHFANSNSIFTMTRRLPSAGEEDLVPSQTQRSERRRKCKRSAEAHAAPRSYSDIEYEHAEILKKLKSSAVETEDNDDNGGSKRRKSIFVSFRSDRLRMTTRWPSHIYREDVLRRAWWLHAILVVLWASRLVSCVGLEKWAVGTGGVVGSNRIE